MRVVSNAETGWRSLRERARVAIYTRQYLLSMTIWKNANEIGMDMYGSVRARHFSEQTELVKDREETDCTACRPPKQERTSSRRPLLGPSQTFARLFS